MQIPEQNHYNTNFSIIIKNNQFMKKIVILIAATLFMVVGMQAQHKDHQGDKAHKHHPRNPEQRAELRKHYETQMYPVLKTKHDAFDAALSADDLKFLEGKRAENKQLQVDKRAMHKQISAAIKEGKDKDAVKAQFSSQREELKNRRKALEASFQPFIEKNRALLDKTIEELTVYKDQWKAERKAINEKYNPEGEAKREEFKKQHSEHSKKDWKEKNPEKAAMHQNKKEIRFLLWDGELKEFKGNGKKAKNVDSPSRVENGLNNEKIYKLSAYPNPAVSETNISFELPKEASVVNITLSDFKGSILREIPMKNLHSGTHSVQLNLNGLEKGKYAISIQVDGKTISSTLLIN